MATITPASIKELRDRTGIGMGKCKEALEEAHGDIEVAIANLRKAGMASAVKKEGRSTNEGMIGVAEHGGNIALVEVNAETDFVVRNERFQQFLKDIAEEVAQLNPPSLEAFLSHSYSKDSALTIDQYRATLVQAIGENIQLRRLVVLHKGNDKSIGVYSHLGGKIVTAVVITGSDQERELAKEIAMHVAAAAPEYLNAQEIPAHVIEQEQEIARSQIQGKPANIIDKIIEGKINAYFDTVCLEKQPFIKNDSLRIGDLVNQRAKETGKPLKLTKFYRWTVGQ